MAKTIKLRMKKNSQMNENHLQSNMLLEMAKVGPLNDELVIYIWTNDGGNIPHFHIVDKATMGNEFHTCVKIMSAEYFHHTGKEDVLNSKQKKTLMNFFTMSDKWGDNYWDIVLQEWNRNSSKIEVDRNLPTPDYTKL